MTKLGFFHSVIFPVLQNDQNTCYLINSTFIFGKCHHSLTDFNKSLQSHSYLADVSAANLWRYLSNMKVIFQNSDKPGNNGMEIASITPLSFRQTIVWSNIRADSGLVPSQWEMSLQSNVVSHWLCANLESALQYHCQMPTTPDNTIKREHVNIITSCAHSHGHNGSINYSLLSL